jgi:acylglycerol lipase
MPYGVKGPYVNRWLLSFLAISLLGCAGPQLQLANDITQEPVLYPEAAVMADGYRLPLAVHKPAGEPNAILLALHGFNDYRNAFHGPGRYFADRGIMTVAYDQRGFGETAQRGIWPGRQLLQQDATSLASLLCQRYPDVPLYLLGESMGGAVSILTAIENSNDCLRGVILAAPAIWGWQTMPFWQGTLLRVAAQVVPAHEVTGEGLEIRPSDNIEMLRALGRDPLVIKSTRIDAIYGLTELMDQAYRASSEVTLPVLLLYGEHDEVIPKHALCRMVAALPDGRDSTWRMVLYPDGYHMLARDLLAETVLEDIVTWVNGQYRKLPSGDAVSRETGRLEAFCGGSLTGPAVP